MPKTIKILPESLANKIAAGEVVQRPASAVKELIENAIDAGAKSISIIIKDGGKSLIHIIDDGSGMSREDAALAFERHSTSKIASYEDLENIRTLGFRGEALASVAAISQAELRTRQSRDEVGTKIRIEGGVVLENSLDAAVAGTSLVIRNLFYNTPGRRNFLKSDNTEFRHVFDVIQRVAISHPELAIKFTSNDEPILDLRKSEHQERIAAVFGEKLASTVFFFEQESELARVSGYLGKPDHARKSRAEQYLFLNNRSIINRNISHAVFKAYEHLLEKSSFPLFILFMTIDPHKVDVNVHPSKMEVKFEDESAMYRFVHSAVARMLSGHDLIPTVGADSERPPGEFIESKFRSGEISSGQRVTDWRELIRRESPIEESERKRDPGDQDGIESDRTTPGQFQAVFGLDPQFADPVAGRAGRTSDIEPTASSAGTFPLWQIHNKYILAPIEGGLMVIDQHAAHERVLYERAVARFDGAHAKTQQLLFPHTLEMTPGDIALVNQLKPLLERLGFSVKIFGKTSVVLDGVPIDVKPGDEKSILPKILDLFKEDEHSVKLEPRERLAKSFSCKAAIKAGDPLKDAEMHSLLDQLFATEIPYVCPHGRPVIIKFSLSELDRRFGRTS